MPAKVEASRTKAVFTTKIDGVYETKSLVKMPVSSKMNENQDAGRTRYALTLSKMQYPFEYPKWNMADFDTLINR
jgi:hypothetical protein